MVDTESSSEHSTTGSESEDDADNEDDVNDTSDTDIPLSLEEIGSELSEEAYDYSSLEEDDEPKKSK